MQESWIFIKKWGYMNFKVLLNMVFVFGFLFNNVFSENVVAKESNIGTILNVLRSVDNSFTDNVSLDVVPISYEKFVSGCEVVSIVNLLNYYKYKINLSDFYEHYFVHKDWTLIASENKQTNAIEKFMYGPHPNYAFPGDPTIASGDNCGFGCFRYAICDSINNFLKECDKTKKYDAVFEEEVSTDDAISRFVENGVPVLIWSTQPDDKNVPVEKISKTVLKMRKSGGQGDRWVVNFPELLEGKTYVWTKGEHCSLLIGESDECYKVCDPFRGIIYVDKESLNKSRQIFNNSIVYLKEQIPKQKQIEKVIDIISKIKNETSNKLN